ncbi:MAG TPA: hypothetical protein VM537_34370, partial [Anaerolineae bacterium]|nr:hypothetical protein [Anaerolineae bacterium]
MWTIARALTRIKQVSKEDSINGGFAVAEMSRDGFWESPAVVPYLDGVRMVCEMNGTTLERMIDLAKMDVGDQVKCVLDENMHDLLSRVMVLCQMEDWHTKEMEKVADSHFDEAMEDAWPAYREVMNSRYLEYRQTSMKEYIKDPKTVIGEKIVREEFLDSDARRLSHNNVGSQADMIEEQRAVREATRDEGIYWERRRA